MRGATLPPGGYAADFQATGSSTSSRLANHIDRSKTTTPNSESVNIDNDIEKQLREWRKKLEKQRCVQHPGIDCVNQRMNFQRLQTGRNEIFENFPNLEENCSRVSDGLQDGNEQNFERLVHNTDGIGGDVKSPVADKLQKGKQKYFRQEYHDSSGGSCGSDSLKSVQHFGHNPLSACTIRTAEYRAPNPCHTDHGAGQVTPRSNNSILSSGCTATGCALQPLDHAPLPLPRGRNPQHLWSRLPSPGWRGRTPPKTPGNGADPWPSSLPSARPHPSPPPAPLSRGGLGGPGHLGMAHDGHASVSGGISGISDSVLSTLYPNGLDGDWRESDVAQPPSELDAMRCLNEIRKKLALREQELRVLDFPGAEAKEESLENSYNDTETGDDEDMEEEEIAPAVFVRRPSRNLRNMALEDKVMEEKQEIIRLQHALRDADIHIAELETQLHHTRPNTRAGFSGVGGINIRGVEGLSPSMIGNHSEVHSDTSTATSMGATSDTKWHERAQALERDIHCESAVACEIQDRIHWLRVQLRKQPGTQEERITSIQALLTQLAGCVQGSTPTPCITPQPVVERIKR